MRLRKSQKIDERCVEMGKPKLKKNEMRGIGVIYPDEYPWEWYDPSKDYEVVIAKREDLKSKDVNFNLIELS